MAIDLARFLPLFYQEADEHLSAMERHLLRLDPNAPDPEALHSIFRAVHSIKGNSAILGASEFSDVLHRLETVLDRLRHEEIRADDALVSLLLEACDVLREALRRLKDTGDNDLQALQALFERLAGAAAPRVGNAMPRRPPEALQARSERFRIEVCLPVGQDIAALPLPQLYAELGALGRLEDLHTQTHDGAATLSLDLLTTATEHEIRDKLALLVPAGTLHVERRELAPPPPALPGEPAQLAAPAAFGRFDESRAGEDSLTRTSLLALDARGRRLSDADSSGSVLGRRASDRFTSLHDRSSIRVDVDKVDRLLNLVGELVIAQSMLAEAAARVREASASSELSGSVAYVARQTRELQEAVMGIRLLPIEFLFSRMPRLTRDLARRLGKEVELVVRGGETELDREMIEKLADPLTHLVRNSLDHGIEPPAVRQAAGKLPRGRIELTAKHQGGGILVEVSDDGAGFDREKILDKARAGGFRPPASMTDEEVWQLVFAPGFTTAEEVSEVSGRGVGMDVVKRNIRALGGHIDIRSRDGAGTSIVIRLPLTLAIVEGMLVEIGGERFILPLTYISEAFRPQPGQVKTIAGGPRVLKVRESYLPLLTLEGLLGVRARAETPQEGIAVVLDLDGRRAALAVDRLVAQQQVVIKSLERNYRRVPGVAGATVLGDGRVALILDVNALMRPGLAPSNAVEALETEAGVA